MEVRSLGWSKSTGGAVSGQLEILRGDTLEEVKRNLGDVKGKVVMRPPSVVPTEEPENAYDAVIAPQHGIPRSEGMSWGDRKQLIAYLAQQGAAVVLLDSAKADSLFNMTSMSKHEPSLLPMAFATHEDYSLLYRLAQAGTVTLRIQLNGSFSKGQVRDNVVVAEIKGSEKTDERVILGAHLDSWDLGQGAVDNGAGSMAVLEAARAIKALGWKPKRTLTFVLFTGEEQSLIGSYAFVESHKAEVPRMDGVLIHDTGTGRVTSIALEDLYETASLMAEIYTPMQEVFDLQPLSTRVFSASDHVPFLKQGVPAYFCIQKAANYRQDHHSQSDTFDKVIPDEINQGAAVIAAWAWNVSEMPTPLPHHPPGSTEADF